MIDTKIESWRDLLVWQKSHALTLEIYRLTKSFPADERFRLVDQLCRAAASIPTNIAEGKGRGSTAEFSQFLIIARGSIEETRYHILLARDLTYIVPDDYDRLESTCTEISKMTNALLRSLRT
ncbi:MAG: four helix bundle protein [Verrucomicrobia bacterium]|nr:four helix bundle protein [Verrucomicrobiota bacterium]